MKFLKRILLGIAAAVACFILVLYLTFFRTFLDKPYFLENKTDTIEVKYIAWACDCASWLESKYYNNPGYTTIGENDCIYLEPASKDLDIPSRFYDDIQGNRLLLIGNFYKTKGIPDDHISFDVVKSEPARVFRYTKIKILRPDS